jgi:hypothetical protein
MSTQSDPSSDAPGFVASLVNDGIVRGCVASRLPQTDQPQS